MNSVLYNMCYFAKGRAFQILWISIVIYSFYNTFIYYQEAPQFHHLRNILGLGLYVSRGTATVLNISSALVLLPLCKKLNKLLYRVLSKVWPGLFFFWLEKAKSFHMTVAITLVLFALIHSISHFANLWNFSRNYNEKLKNINFANYKNENPVSLLLTQPGLTGVSMLLITTLMGMTSSRVVRRRCYNAFWYTHHLYLPFMVMLLVHPLSGVLKEEILQTEDASLNSSQLKHANVTMESPRFVAIKSKDLIKKTAKLKNVDTSQRLKDTSTRANSEPKTWLWMAFPLSCFLVDLLWRLFSRNRARVEILQVTHMPGRTISLTLSCPQEFHCRMGQYVLLQCLDISLIEWHPFTVVKLPTPSQRIFIVWIRVTGDWTEALEILLLERGPKTLSMLVDGPFSSPMEGVGRSNIAVCIAAGVGITPFVASLQAMLMQPRSRLPGRIHLIWIVRHGYELSWLAELANKTILELRNANRPDRLHLELYVTSSSKDDETKNSVVNEFISHIVAINENGGLTHNLITRNGKVISEDERISLLTPNKKRNVNSKIKEETTESNTFYIDNNYDIVAKYPLLGCRIKRGRPCWDRVFGYWAYLYPDEPLNLYCCGPKKLVKLLRHKSKQMSQRSSATITFVHEGFS